jgi:hypothetical protein
LFGAHTFLARPFFIGYNAIAVHAMSQEMPHDFRSRLFIVEQL